MKRALFSLSLLVAISAGAQVTQIMIPAGTPEDQATGPIIAENDPEKKVALLLDYVQKFASDQQALAWGDWQLSQSYLDQGDTAKALDFSQKAMALQPNNLDILVSVANVAQRAKAPEVVIDAAVRGGNAFNGMHKEAKPEGISDEEFALHIKSAQEPLQQSYDFLEVAAWNTMADEQDPKRRMAWLERFIAAFPGSRFQEQATQLAVYTLGQLNESAKLVSFGEKALAANPNSIPTLVVLAEAFSQTQEASYAVRAEGYARKALDLAKNQKPDQQNKLQLYNGLAHSALGFALMKQDKNVPAITELKAASSELKDQPDAYSTALYRLGFVYAKTGKLPEAKATLTEAVAIKGPYQQPARDLLAKVDAAATRTTRKK